MSGLIHVLLNKVLICFGTKFKLSIAIYQHTDRSVHEILVLIRYEPAHEVVTFLHSHMHKSLI